jgi:hypothetical protein
VAESTSGGGFQATVRRGVFKTRGAAKLAAARKTARNFEVAVKRSTAAIEVQKGILKQTKADLAEAKRALKYWEGEAKETGG